MLADDLRRFILSIADEIVDLSKREAELESLMKQPGGARITQERELHAVKRKLGILSLSEGADHPLQAESNLSRIETAYPVCSTKK